MNPTEPRSELSDREGTIGTCTESDFRYSCRQYNCRSPLNSGNGEIDSFARTSLPVDLVQANWSVMGLTLQPYSSDSSVFPLRAATLIGPNHRYWVTAWKTCLFPGCSNPLVLDREVARPATIERVAVRAPDGGPRTSRGCAFGRVRTIHVLRFPLLGCRWTSQPLQGRRLLGDDVIRAFFSWRGRLR